MKESSGKSRRVHCRFACPKFLRQTFHEFAGHSIGHSEWAKAYYEHLRNDEKKGHHAAVRSLAFKWTRIIFRCWQDRKPYDEEIYLQSLRRRGSLLGAAAIGPTTQFGYTMVAGFQKLSKNFLKKISIQGPFDRQVTLIPFAPPARLDNSRDGQSKSNPRPPTRFLRR